MYDNLIASLWKYSTVLERNWALPDTYKAAITSTTFTFGNHLQDQTFIAKYGCFSLKSKGSNGWVPCCVSALKRRYLMLSQNDYLQLMFSCIKKVQVYYVTVWHVMQVIVELARVTNSINECFHVFIALT